MNRRLVGLIFLLVLSACVSTEPLNNAPFSAIAKIEQLEGVYKNLGDGGSEKNTSLYLTSILWADEKLLDHQLIERIEVKKQMENTLVVNALQGNKIIRTKIFRAGQDFKIQNGVIVLSSEAGIAGFKSGEPMLGVYAGGSKIGLDEKGHGKFHSSGTAAGLAFMFLPIAVSGSQDVRFYRIEK